MIRGRNLLVGIVVVCAGGCGSSRRLNSGAAGIGGAGAGQGGDTGGTSTGGAAGTGGAGGTSTGGAAGTGGAGAQAGSAGGASTGDCGARDPFGPHLWTSTMGPDHNSIVPPPYDGPAVVEDSWAGSVSLVLPTGPTHVRIGGLDSAPVFPVGAQVWLSAHILDVAGTFYHTDPWSIAVRDREGGTLLFGAALDPYDQAPSPVSIGKPVADCVVPNYKPACSANTPALTMTYQSVEVQGDAPVVIHDSHPGTVTLGGEDYAVRLTARKLSEICWFNSNNEDGLALDIQASNLSSLVAGLTVGPPPSCREGTDPSHDVYFDLTGVSATAFDRTVVFKGVNADDGAYDYDIPGLQTTSGTAAVLSLKGAAASLPMPAVGQQFWLSHQQGNSALGTIDIIRDSQQGPLVLAQEYAWDKPDGGAQLAAALGTTVTLEPRCAWTSDIQLWDVVFGTTPPVRVQAGTIGDLTLDGRPYHAWSGKSSAYNVLITIYPALQP